MADLLLIVPSRERPHNALAFAEAWSATTVEESTDLLFAIDTDDPTRRDYEQVFDEWAGPGDLMLLAEPRTSMCGALNHHATQHAGLYDVIGFAGDDHRLRTPHWDRIITDTLDELGTGIAYGNDLIHGEGLPTAVFMTADIIRTAGYMAPPRQHHLWLDNAWLELGRTLDAIRYLPDVTIEHMHPLVGKAETDDGYTRVNAPDLNEHDRLEFERWRVEELPQLAERIRANTPVH